MEENWKTLAIDNRYSISTNGNIISNVYKEPRRLHPVIDNRGYYYVRIRNKAYNVHRLVALTFIPTNDTTLHIDHIDGNKLNNHISNLRWCTPKYNNSYGTKTKRQLETCKKHDTSNAEKEVVMLSLDGDIVNVYKSLSDASRQTGLSLGSLSEVCNKMPHRLTLGGYKWKFKE